MLTELRLENVRVFDDAGWAFPLKGLSVLCGTNSAGKSTILKCLVLLKQSFGGRIDLSRRPVKLRFRADVDLGSFKSFVSHREPSRNIVIGVTFTNVLSNRSVQLLPQELKPAPEKAIKGAHYTMSCDFHFSSGSAISAAASDTTVDRNAESAGNQRLGDNDGVLTKANFSLQLRGAELPLNFEVHFEPSNEEAAAQYSLRFPAYLIPNTNEQAPPLTQPTASDTTALGVFMRGLLPERLVRASEVDQPSRGRSTRLTALPEVIDESLGDLVANFENINYIGPLRAPAERYYGGQNEVNAASDSSGKSFPQLLKDGLNIPLHFLSPLTFEPRNDLAFEDALDYWLHYLRTGNANPTVVRREISVGFAHDVFFEINLRSQNGEESHALADSGFGYSQLLPILARGLLLSPGMALIIEQPEVHLNPALQIRLCEFFLTISMAGGQVLIETHSEHVVDYFRARSAEDARIVKSGILTVLYLETIGLRPQLHNLCILPGGSIPAWPENFFGESQRMTARILRAQRQHLKDGKPR